MFGPVRKLEEMVLAALARGEEVDACALLLLLRRYRSSGAGDLADAVGRALAGALDGHRAETTIADCSRWVELFVEARALSDDERLTASIDTLVTRLRGAWASPEVAESTAAIGACLHAAGLTEFRALAAAAIDRLEHVVGAAYEPGEELGSQADQVGAASALLTAYTLSGRLPYPMLAEELMQTTRRAPIPDFVCSCDAARVLCRLAALHADPGYRAAAIVAPDADYRADAAKLLADRADDALGLGCAGAIYGVAWLELKSEI